MEPDVNGRFTSDLATPIFKLSDTAKNDELSFEGKEGLIGSCTNSSNKDNEALSKGLKHTGIFQSISWWDRQNVAKGKENTVVTNNLLTTAINFQNEMKTRTPAAWAEFPT